MPAPELLSGPAREALAEATERCVSAASRYEVACKAMLGEWPEVQGLLPIDLNARLRFDEFEVIPASWAIPQRTGRVDWAYLDPFDRIIVAAALERAVGRVEGRHAGRGAGRSASPSVVGTSLKAL